MKLREQIEWLERKLDDCSASEGDAVEEIIATLRRLEAAEKKMPKKPETSYFLYDDWQDYMDRLESYALALTVSEE